MQHPQITYNDVLQSGPNTRQVLFYKRSVAALHEYYKTGSNDVGGPL